MATIKQARKTDPTNCPLIEEPYPEGYSGLPFVTLILYRKQSMLVIVDNMDDSAMKVFNLELCEAEKIDQNMILNVALEWYGDGTPTKPISMEFSKRGMTSVVSRVYRTLNLEFVSRLVGPTWKFPMSDVKQIKRRRRRAPQFTISSSVDEE
jgi:hypothetical protein